MRTYFLKIPGNNSDLTGLKNEVKIIDNKPNLLTAKLIRLGNNTAS